MMINISKNGISDHHGTSEVKLISRNFRSIYLNTFIFSFIMDETICNENNNRFGFFITTILANKF